MILLLISIAVPLTAQPTGSISGTVRDPSGAVLPGATVTIESALLPAPQVIVTGADGGFDLPALPVGRYTVVVELVGFEELQQGVTVEADRNVDLDVTLTFGGFDHPEDVVGVTPAIDPRRSSVEAHIDETYLQNVPNGRNVWSVLEQTPAVVLDRFDIGGSEGARQSQFSAAGTSPRQNQYTLNGANVTDPAAPGATTTYFSYDALEEIDVSTSAHSADIQSPGVHLNLVLKDAGGVVRGGGAFYFEDGALQSGNLDDSLRAMGVSETNRLEKYTDYHLELGAPFSPDRARYYAHFAEQRIEPYVIGFFLPGFEPGTDPTELRTLVLRATFAPRPAHRIEGLFYRNDKIERYRDAGRSRPAPETALYQDSTAAVVQAHYNGSFGPDLLLRGRFSLVDMDFPLGERPDAPSDAFSRIDLLTGVRSGGPGQNRIFERRRWQGSATLSLFADDWLGGSHDFDLGWELHDSPAETSDRLNGSILYRDLLGAPFQVELYSDPVRVTNHVRSVSAFAQDSWVVGRLALDLGLRFDRWTAGYPQQTKEAGPWDHFFIEHGMVTSSQARSNIIRWNSLVPRLGVVYDLTGDGVNLIKASYSRYAHQIGTDLPDFANPVGRAVALFGFDDLNGNRLLDEGEVDFDEPLAVNIPSQNEIDPDIAPAVTDELTLSLERKVGSGFAGAARFIYRKDRRLIDDVNVGVPFDRYEPVSARDPGLDLVPGTEDDRTLTVFDQSPDTLGQDSFLLTNPEGLDGAYTGLRLEARKLFSRRWQMLTSLTVGKSTGFLPGPGWETNEGSGFATPLYGNPNTLINAEGSTFWDRSYIFRASGSYSDFFGFTLGASVRIQTGQPLYRSILVDATLDGRPLAQGAVEVLADPQGFARHPRVSLIDARIARELFLGRYGRLDITGDIFNLLNANTATELAQRGRGFGAITEILAPRVVRLGVRYRF